MAEYAEIVALFNQHDANQDGTIDEAELVAVMSGIGFSEEECVKMFSEADMNRDGVIKYEEFVAWVFSEDAQEEAPERESVAPFIKQAFELMAKTITDTSMAVMEEDADLQAAAANEEATKQQFVELLGKSFDHHDTSGTGALKTAEAKVFFSNLVSESGAFMEAVVSMSMKKMIDMTLKSMLGAMTSEDPETSQADTGAKMAMLAAMREGLKLGMEDTKATCAKQLEEYKANKEQRDAAAFAIIDADSSGSIAKEEFIAAFTPGNEKSDRVMEALGLETPD